MATKKQGPPAKEAPGAGAKRAPPGKKANDPKDQATLEAIRDAAAGIRDMINKKKKPELKMPVRALSNVKYDPKKGFFEIGKDKKVRTLSVATVKTFAQTLKMMALSKELVANDDFATKRDAYYQSKNWGDARFDEPSESDTVVGSTDGVC